VEPEHRNEIRDFRHSIIEISDRFDLLIAGQQKILNLLHAISDRRRSAASE